MIKARLTKKRVRLCSHEAQTLVMAADQNARVRAVRRPTNRDLSLARRMEQIVCQDSEWHICELRK
jgi:hypothetical protein